MIDAYKTDTIEQHGKTYRIEWVFDYDMGPPWQAHDGHGEVSEWTRRGKKPGELVLCEDRGSRRFYDFAGSVGKAKSEGWNTAPYVWKSKGEQAAEAARADYEFLRRWCANDWHWCGIVVTLLDDEGEDTGISASLWGVEDEGYCSRGYHATVIQDLIGECEYQENSVTYPVTHVGI